MTMEADDYFAIQNVLFSYPFALDAGDFDAVGELLGDAVIHSGGALLADRDPKAVANAFRSWVLTYADGTPRTRHMLANVMIVPEGEGKARASSYVMVFQQAGDGPLQAVIGGDYLDRLEKRDGRWRIVERTMGNDLVGDLSRHGRDMGTIKPGRANGAKPLAG
ncbi:MULTISPECIES: nuclear transport factor 2 family protein [Sphingomonas]|uniref:Nuclear transport factor 2 family protein n=1 Tax=Edaphosphingomonas fennica TaxID=114404 RepID=A0A2T4HYN9_9SPHN|nr:MULTISPECIES: nuclear transport factor 2 family protein [Sphingomonas]PTD21191.1 nuclear transport factor 2 family protein [Sphingomonas fennica]